MFTQPDLPEPVVPATSRCGIFARSVQTELPAMSFPSQTESGEPEDRARRLAEVAAEDVAEVHHAVQLVGHLHPDRLLAGDRSQDADVGRGERVGDVVLELRHLRDLGAGREPQLVARHARAGDAADDLRLDAEVAERLDQRLGDLVLVGGVGALALAGLAQQLRVGQPVAAALGLGHPGAPRSLGSQQRGVGDQRLRAAPRGRGSGSPARPAQAGPPRRRSRRPRPRRRHLRLGLGVRQHDLDVRLALGLLVGRRPGSLRASARACSSSLARRSRVCAAAARTPPTRSPIRRPVRSSAPPAIRKKKTRCAPAAENSVEVAQYRASPTTPPRSIIASTPHRSRESPPPGPSPSEPAARPSVRPSAIAIAPARRRAGDSIR